MTTPPAPTTTLSGLAAELYEQVRDCPIVSPHGHVDPSLFVEPDYHFGNPAELLVVPDHYILRMLYSQGVALEDLGVPVRAGAPSHVDPRTIWQTFADHVHLFRGTPTAEWLGIELREVFGISQKLTPATAQEIYDQIDEQLRSDACTPRALYERFGLRVLCTTDSVTDTLDHHRAIRNSGWSGTVLPTFRPDPVVAIDAPGWRDEISRLSEVSEIDVGSYANFITALERRRDSFRQMGAVATDHGVTTPHTEILSDAAAETVFARALAGEASAGDALAFRGHMLCEMARMSCEDGLVMQIHAGACRDHNPDVYQRYGSDLGGDMPIRTEFTLSLRPLLARHGNDHRLRLVLFSLDESPYARELAPLAGHYPALRIGPPWWFYDSWNGMARYFDRVMETAGLYNTAGFNDDTRAYPSIPARHDVWRRASATWVAGLLQRGAIDDDDAAEMMQDLAWRLALATYRLEEIG